MKIDVTEVIVAIIGLVGVIISTWLIPYLKSKTTASRWDSIVSWAKVFVEGAELIYDGPAMGKEKREHVMNALREECEQHHIKYSESEIRSALESAVLKMKASLKSTHNIPLEDTEVTAEVSE